MTFAMSPGMPHLCQDQPQEEPTMADPQAAVLTQLRNIEARTGKRIAELHELLTASGLQKTGERRSLLMEQLGMGYGDANTVALLMGKPLPALDGSAPPPAAAEAGDMLDTIYSGKKAALRPLHDAVMALVKPWGEFEQAPKKSYVSLRRKKQFAMLGPATQTAVELGLNVKDLPPAARLKAQAPGGMCQYTVRLSAVEEADAELAGWLRAAFDAAG
jgi:Domain of unknown function (DUF5655)/Domain of unknown function (DUF4287)